MQLDTGKNRILGIGVNTIYVTVSEANLFNNATYTLVVKEETTMQTKSITIVDTSLNPIRYNEFDITLVNNLAAEDLANGIVCLNTGKHTYQITSTSSTLPAQTMVCEDGIIFVEKAVAPIGTSYTSNVPPTTYTSYTGNISSPL